MKKNPLFYLIPCVLLLFTCKDENNLIESQVFSDSPVVKETKTAKSVTRISAVSGGTIATTKGKTLISRGVCWGVAEAPVFEQNHSSDGKERGDFTSTLTGLLPKTTYYVRAYAQTSDEIVYGPEQTFETQPNNTPAVPSVPSPATEATESPVNLTLSWTASDPDGDSLTYTVYFGTNSNPTTLISTNQSSKTLSRSGLTGNTRYYWKVIAKDPFGETATSPVWFFTTGTVNNPPSVPSNPSPASTLATLQPTTVSLSWSCSDPDGEALTYDVYFGTNSTPSVIVSTNQTTQNFTPSGLTANTIYYWKIVAKDSKGGTSTGPVWNFKTELTSNNPPDVPSDPSPSSDLTALQPTTVTLSWSCSDPDGDALTYDVYFGTSSTPTTIVSSNQSSKNYSPSAFTNNTIYYWKIVAKDSKGGTSTGPVWNFKTELANKSPLAPSSPSPASNLTSLQPITVSLSWACSDPDGDALTYDVYFGTSSTPTTIVSANQTAKTFTPSGLTTNTIYYWKIVAKDSKNATTTGPVWNLKTELPPNFPPVAPSNPTPASNLTMLQPTTVSLSWACSDPEGDAITYDVYFGTSSTPTTIVSANQTAKNYTASSLINNTIYYWKIVAKDSGGGTTTGAVWNFKTHLSYDFTLDGFLYKTVVIGTQVWTVENLRTTKYNDGTSITKVTDDNTWTRTTGAYCAYDNTESNVATYGYLYNWYAVATWKFVPTGWRVPTDADWTKLTVYVGSTTAGNKLKAKTGWINDRNGTDNYGFSALPGGYRNFDGSFYGVGGYGYWWSSSAFDTDYAWTYGMMWNEVEVRRSSSKKWLGFSVRLVRDL